MKRAVLLPLLLAACGSPAPAPAPSRPKPPAEHGYLARVQALSPARRQLVLYRAVLSSGGDACQDVKQVVPLPASRDGLPTWELECTGNGGQWLVGIRDDGTALVSAVRPRG